MCPACRKPMIAMELEGIEIDHCLDCGGTWLDAGEIEAITERAGVNADRLADTVKQAKAGERGRRRCPRCRRRMRIIRLDEPAGLELDRCPLEHGLWFDQGEMRSLISAAAEDKEGAVALFFADLYRSELEAESKGD